MQQIAPIMGHVLWLLSRRPLPPQCFPRAIKSRGGTVARGGGKRTKGGGSRTEGRRDREEKKIDREEYKHCNISPVSFSPSLETPLAPWATSSTATAKKQNREQKKGNTQRRGRTVDRPESAPQAATTSTSTKPLQRDKNTVYRENEKKQGKKIAHRSRGKN